MVIWKAKEFLVKTIAFRILETLFGKKSLTKAEVYWERVTLRPTNLEIVLVLFSVISNR